MIPKLTKAPLKEEPIYLILIPPTFPKKGRSPFIGLQLKKNDFLL
jgi:hypothetical protein